VYVPCHLTDLHTFLKVTVIYRSALIRISLSDEEWPPWSPGIHSKSYWFSESLLLQGYMEAFLPRCVTYTKLVGLSIWSILQYYCLNKNEIFQCKTCDPPQRQAYSTTKLIVTNQKCVFKKDVHSDVSVYAV